MLQPPGSMGSLQASGCAEPLSGPQNPPDTHQSCSPQDPTAPVTRSPPTLLPFPPCTHQALGEGFYPVPTHHPRYPRELPTPHHVTNQPQFPGGPRSAVCRAGGGVRAAPARGGGTCAVALWWPGHVPAPRAPRSPLRAPSRPSTGTFPPRGARAVNKPGAPRLFTAASHLASHK